MNIPEKFGFNCPSGFREEHSNDHSFTVWVQPVH
jgi:hypothetical protein